MNEKISQKNYIMWEKKYMCPISYGYLLCKSLKMIYLYTRETKWTRKYILNTNYKWNIWRTSEKNSDHQYFILSI